MKNNILDVVQGTNSLSFKTMRDYFITNGEVRHFLKGNNIVLENQVSKTVMIILSGTVKVSKKVPPGDEVTLAILKEGSIIGELALFIDNQRHATIKTLTDVTAIQLNKVQFLKMFSAHPSIQYYILSSMASRINFTNDLYYNSEQKVKMLLIGFRLLQVFHDQNEQGAMLGTIRLNVLDSAEALKVPINVVQNKIKIFKDANIILNFFSDGANNLTFQLDVTKLREFLAEHSRPEEF